MAVYDDVFHTLCVDCRELLIPIINEVFHENHNLEHERILGLVNERFQKAGDGELQKRISDSILQIEDMKVDYSGSGTIKRYHLECESSPYDREILIRMFEYDSLIAMAEPFYGGLDKNSVVYERYQKELIGREEKEKSDELIVNFPRSAIIYLRSSDSTPSELRLKIVTEEGSVYQRIQVLKLKEYSIEHIFEKKMYFLIPFYVFNREQEIKREIRRGLEYLSAQIDKIKSDYEKIRTGIEKAIENKELNEYEKVTLINMTIHVVRGLFGEDSEVKKGVEEIMGGGKILEYEAKDILRNGIEQGMEQGIECGRMKTLISQICKKTKKGNTPKQISELLEEDEKQVEKIYRVVQKHAPEYDEGEIYRELFPAMIVQEERNYSTVKK